MMGDDVLRFTNDDVRETGPRCYAKGERVLRSRAGPLHDFIRLPGRDPGLGCLS